MVEFIEGPLWYFSLIVFAVGVAWRILDVFRLGVKPDLAPTRPGPGAFGTLIRRSWPRREMLHTSWVQYLAGYAFHIGLFVLVLFAAPHVDFIESQIGLSWTPVPYWGFILAANFAFAGLMLLWLRRLMDPVLKQISSKDDHIGSILVFVVMFTGCMALMEAHDALRALHMLTVEALLIYFPFSRLMHAFFFLSSRSYTGATYGRRGLSV